MVRIEGADDVIDYEVLDRDGRRLAVRQAKTRASGTWGAAELARILCAWGELEDADAAQFAFVTDGRLGTSGTQLQDLIFRMRRNPDIAEVQATSRRLGRGGVKLPGPDVLARVEIQSELGTVDGILARLERKVHLLMESARVVTVADSENAVNGLFRALFVMGGATGLERRTITRAQVISALGLDGQNLHSGLEWSAATADSYHRAIGDRAARGRFLPLDVEPGAGQPAILDLIERVESFWPTPGGPAPDGTGPCALEEVLGTPVAALVGATGQGKTMSLRHLAWVAASLGLVPILLPASGHTPGTLGRRVRAFVEEALGQRLTPGAVESLLAAHELVLLIDGASEADEDATNALRGDLQRLAVLRPLRVVATGRDPARTSSVLASVGPVTMFHLKPLDDAARRALAEMTPGLDADTVDLIEQRLPGAADNPMLFLMAAAISHHGVPDSRAAVYRQFLDGLVARAHIADPEPAFAAFSVAWARLIGVNRRSIDRYSWPSELAASLEHLETVPRWRGARCTPTRALTVAADVGLLTSLDPEGGLAPLHDSFADFLAGRAMASGDAPWPETLTTPYDEAVLFAVETGGLDAHLVLRLARENPLLACRVAHTPQAVGSADPILVGQLLDELARECDLPLLKARGLRITSQTEYTGVVLVDEDRRVVGLQEFEESARDHPAMLLRPDAGSLIAAVGVWTAAVRASHRPSVRLFQPAPPVERDAAAKLLDEHVRAVAVEIGRMVDATLPPSIRRAVLDAVGPLGINAVIGENTQDPWGSTDLLVHYLRGTKTRILSGADGASRLDGYPFTDTAANLMRLHPRNHAALQIERALDALTDRTWTKR